MQKNSVPEPVVLIVDDDREALRSLVEAVEAKGFQAISVTSGDEGVAIAKVSPLRLAIVDYHMPGMDGLVTIAKLKEVQPGLRTVLMTVQGEEKLLQAVEGLDEPSFDKEQMGRLWESLQGFGSHQGMIIMPSGIGSGVESVEMLAGQQHLQPFDPGGAFPSGADDALESLARVVGNTKAVSELKQAIANVAALDCNVVILGEPGTGKELVARTIHEISARRTEPFIAVNCGSFMPDMLADELFGHVKGAFTGARSSKRGAFESASGGTILLNEVGNTPPSLQAQLYHALEGKAVTRFGSDEELAVDVRFLAAADTGLELLVRDGIFREDLYYKLNAYTISIPPLRERIDDIEILGSYFLNKCNRAFGKKVEAISDEALNLLSGYHFPGNVHELENIIERAVIVCDATSLQPRHLPERFRVVQPTTGQPRRRFPSLAELERDYVYEVLDYTGGNKNEAAKMLKINRASLWRKLKRYEEEA